MAENYEIVIKKFIKKWENRKYVIAAMLTGSRATDFYSPCSDIDIYIILSDKVNWREKGNELIDGLLIEYFANPIKQIRAYFRQEYSRNSKSTARMFAMGNVIFDKENVIPKLKKEAVKWLRKKFKKPTKRDIEMMKYYIWDNLDNLYKLYYSKSKDFEHHYHFTLRYIITSYAKFLRIEVPHPAKTYKTLTNKEYRKQYFMEDFKDEKFVRLYINCLNAKSTKQKMKAIEDLVRHVLEKMGGFEINGFKIRSKLDLR